MQLSLPLATILVLAGVLISTPIASAGQGTKTKTVTTTVFKTFTKTQCPSTKTSSSKPTATPPPPPPPPAGKVCGGMFGGDFGSCPNNESCVEIWSRYNQAGYKVFACKSNTTRPCGGDQYGVCPQYQNCERLSSVSHQNAISIWFECAQPPIPQCGGDVLGWCPANEICKDSTWGYTCQPTTSKCGGSTRGWCPDARVCTAADTTYGTGEYACTYKEPPYCSQPDNFWDRTGQPMKGTCSDGKRCTYVWSDWNNPPLWCRSS